MGRQASVAAVVSGSPFRIQLKLVIPDRSEIDEFRRQSGDPHLSGHRQAMAQQKLRVAEVLWEKQNQPLLGARAAIPLICEQQQHFLLTGDRRRLVDVSLADLARATGFRAHVLASSLKGHAVRCPVGVFTVDRLIGLVGNGLPGPLVVPVDPRLLIPTDDECDQAAYEGFVRVLEEGRQGILDPILIVSTPSLAPRAYVVQGHHRTAAAFSCGLPVGAIVLRRKEQLSHLCEGNVADLAATCQTFDEFAAKLRRRCELFGLLEQTWAAWLAGAASPR